MSLDDYSTSMNRELFIQDIIKRQYAEISKQSLLSEKRVTEILSEVVNDYKCFYKLHSFVDFRKINQKFYKTLCSIVAKLYYHEKIGITNHILEYQYTRMMLELVSKRKQVFNDIILNAISEDTDTKKRDKQDLTKSITERINKE